MYGLKNYKFMKSKYNIEHIPILKSNLQKSIRRSNTENALKTAFDWKVQKNISKGIEGKGSQIIH